MRKFSLFSLLYLLALSPALLADVEFAPNGGFITNGIPVQLIGNLIYELPTAENYRSFPGEPPGWEWLYECPPSRAQFDRLGFNATGGEVPTDWMRKYRPEGGFWQAARQMDWSIGDGYYKNGLPAWVDYTCAGWSHGGLAYDSRRPPSAAAFSAGDCHFLPYSLITDEGLNLYREMWQSGARELIRHGVKPFVYELFNEPAYDDRSPAAEAAFMRHLDSLPSDRPPAADEVERRKFNQRHFANAVARGKTLIREIDPTARTCFQPLQSVGYFICADIDLYAANRTTDLVVAPTGGGDAWDALLLLAVAGNRPIVDGEAYPGTTRASHRARILSEYARGLNGTYYFKWDRRATSAIWKEKDAPARLAEQYPYCALNPASVPPEAFAGLKDAARDIAAVNDLFTPRYRGISASVAVLVSQPTIRLCQAERRTDAIRMREAGEALLAARLPVKALFEEQMDDEHLKGVKLLIAAGIDATLPETNKRLRKWVESGGFLLAVGGKLNRDEWGRARTDALLPTHANKRLGEGRVGLVDRPPSPREATTLYRSIAAKLGIRPSCRITDAETGTEVPNVECAAAQKVKSSAGFILTNHGLTPRAVRLNPIAVGAAHPHWTDITTGEAIAQTADGDLLLRLLPEVPVIIRGERDQPATRPPAAATFFAGLSAWRTVHGGKDISTAAYWLPVEDTSTVDLRAAANCALEETLSTIPWGRNIYAGIPFDLIRIDQNGNRSGLDLAKPTPAIPVEGQARSIAFLFAAPDNWTTEPLFSCTVTYQDGTRATVSLDSKRDLANIGWRNTAGKTLLVACKSNPRPLVPLASLAFSTAPKGTLLAAVTLERPTTNPSARAFQTENVRKAGAWGGLVVHAENDRVRVDVPDAALDWSGIAIDLREPLCLSTDDIATKSLVCEATPGETVHGPVSRPIPIPQFQLGYRTADGREIRGGFVWPGTQIENGTWRTIRIPLRKLLPKDAPAIERLALQFRPFGPERAGCQIRALRIE